MPNIRRILSYTRSSCLQFVSLARTSLRDDSIGPMPNLDEVIYLQIGNTAAPASAGGAGCADRACRAAAWPCAHRSRPGRVTRRRAGSLCLAASRVEHGCRSRAR